MKNDSPFAIRLELLKMAQQQLQGQYQAENDVLRSQWEYDVYHKQQDAPQSERAITTPLQAPKYPTEVEIIALAKQLNDFISNTK